MFFGDEKGSSNPPKPQLPLIAHEGEILIYDEYVRPTYSCVLKVVWNDEKSTGISEYKLTSREVCRSLKVGSKVKLYESGGTIKGLSKLK
jgi:hypothetical protein